MTNELDKSIQPKFASLCVARLDSIQTLLNSSLDLAPPPSRHHNPALHFWLDFQKKNRQGVIWLCQRDVLGDQLHIFLRLFNSLSAFGQGSGPSPAFSISKSAPGVSTEGVGSRPWTGCGKGGPMVAGSIERVVLVVSCVVFRLKILSSELACGCTSCLACWLSLQTFELRWTFRLLVPPVPTCTSVLQSGQQSLVSIVNLSLFLLNKWWLVFLGSLESLFYRDFFAIVS